MTHKITSIAALFLAVTLLLTGCGKFGDNSDAAVPEPQVFSQSGMSITLTDEFIPKDYMSYTACYESEDIAVIVLKEEFSLFEGTEFSAETTVEQYMDLIRRANALPETVSVVTADKLCYIEYDRTAHDKNYTYRAYGFKGTDGFWLVQFATVKENFAQVADQMNAFAQTVTVP